MRARFFWFRTWSALAIGAALNLSLFAQTAAEKKQSPEARWGKDIRAFEAADKTNPPPQGAVLFIGSSSIRLWTNLAQAFPGHKVLNRGFGGSQLSDSVAFVDRIVTPYKPKLVLLYAGDNDIASGKSPERILSDFKASMLHSRRRASPTSPSSRVPPARSISTRSKPPTASSRNTPLRRTGCSSRTCSR